MKFGIDSSEFVNPLEVGVKPDGHNERFTSRPTRVYSHGSVYLHQFIRTVQFIYTSGAERVKYVFE
jgi:hypothetical protein